MNVWVWEYKIDILGAITFCKAMRNEMREMFPSESHFTKR